MQKLTKTEIELLIEATEVSFSKTNRVGQMTKRRFLERLLGKLYFEYKHKNK